MPAAESRRVCISIHDVAPSTWPACRQLLRLVDGFGAVPVTLLVVPDYHRAGRIDAFPDFLRAIEKRLARGDEAALHGYYHVDDSPPPRTPWAWFQRRVLTRSEGEFAVLSREEVERRVRAGLELTQALGWPVEGFIAPAWLPGPARAVLADFPFAYTTTRTGIYRLPEWQFTWSPSLVYSVGSRWRPALSESLDRLVSSLTSSRELVRVSLHPVDAGCPRALSHWSSVIENMLACRTPVTKAQWARAARQCPSALAA